MKTFRLHIVTPDRDFYSGDIEYMSADTPDGKLGLLCGAMPRVTVLSKGTIDIKTSVIDQKVHCGDGLIMVGDGVVTVLSERCRFYGEPDDEPQGQSNDTDVDVAKVGIASMLKSMKEKKSS